MDNRHKSMKASGENLSNTNEQIKILSEAVNIPSFDLKFEEVGEGFLKSDTIETLQINIGKMCNQVCKHCHVDAGPDRKEIMTKETMSLCLKALVDTNIRIVDLTGGAPEMNPEFKWFVKEIRKLNRHVLVRSNLTILVTNGFEDYPEFLAEQKAEVISSLPYYKSLMTDKQRGDGVFEKSMKAMKRLNELGYGKDESGLVFNLVYNPVGAFLPPGQAGLEKDYKRELWDKHGVVFNNLFTITNLPINRYLDYLIASGNYDSYMNKLLNSFNPAAARNVMCKSLISVGWDGYLYDCDFNQMLDMRVNHGVPTHIRDFELSLFEGRKIMTGQHCYGCTAGAGSSCSGATV